MGLYLCGHTLAPSHISHTSKKAGKSAEGPEKKKLELYQELQANYHVIPVGTMGSWGGEGLKFMKDLGS